MCASLYTKMFYLIIQTQKPQMMTEPIEKEEEEYEEEVEEKENT